MVAMIEVWTNISTSSVARQLQSLGPEEKLTYLAEEFLFWRKVIEPGLQAREPGKLGARVVERQSVHFDWLLRSA